jgi:large subunit ribosomal protein L3
MQGLMGKKLGMTQVFDAKGNRVAVTVIEAGPCEVVQHKTQPQDGYDAVQLGFAERKEKHTTKAMRGHFAKAGKTPKRVLREFALEAGEKPDPGAPVTVAIFEKTTYVDVVGVSKGRGFQGVVRRHSMSGGPITHGGHSKRRVGSIGQKADPANVAKGQRMPGHMGHVRVSQKNLRVVELRVAENLILVQGAVPGPVGAVVVLRKSSRQARTAA